MDSFLKGAIASVKLKGMWGNTQNSCSLVLSNKLSLVLWAKVARKICLNFLLKVRHFLALQLKGGGAGIC